MSFPNDTQYVILSKLGEGGMGTVYLAEDTLIKRKVAIKELNKPTSPSAETLDERFQQEALALARLNHPNITHLYAFIPKEGTYWMVMEYVQGKTLEEWIQIWGQLPPLIACSIITQLLDGLYHAHRKGIIHRDLKPANVMISEEEGEVKIMDFGIARIRDSQRITQLGKSVGTLEYMAPEQIQGKEGDERTDVYAAGTILYELLVGKPPYKSDTDYELMRSKLEEKPAMLPQTIPTALQQVILKALDRNPEKRYLNVSLFKEAIEHCFSGKMIRQNDLIAALSNPVEPEIKEPSPKSPVSWPKFSLQSVSNLSEKLKIDNAKRELEKINLNALTGRIKQFLSNSNAAILLLVIVVLLCAGLLIWNNSRQPNTVLNANPPIVDTSAASTSVLPSKDSVATDSAQDKPNPHYSIEGQQSSNGSNPASVVPGNDDQEKKNKKVAKTKKDLAPPVVPDKTKENIASPPPSENKPPASDAGTQEKTTPTPPKDTYTGPVKLPAGQEIGVVLDETLSSDVVSRDGRPVNMHCAEDVRVDGRTIIRKGASVTGKIVDVLPSYKSGRRNALIGFVIISVQAVDGSQVKLKSERYRESASAKGEAAVFSAGQTFYAKLGRGEVD